MRLCTSNTYTMMPAHKGNVNQKGVRVVLVAGSHSKQCHLQACACTLGHRKQRVRIYSYTNKVLWKRSRIAFWFKACSLESDKLFEAIAPSSAVYVTLESHLTRQNVHSFNTEK